jgi:GT2 family glycosyltransferase
VRLEAVRRHLVRIGQAAEAVVSSEGIVSVIRSLPDPRPLVSLIVPTRDRLDLLRPCIESLQHGTDWPAREILICDNDSRDPATHAYFHSLAARGLARAIPCPGPFNFAAMNNAAARQGRGRLLAFINNDVEAFQPDWLERLCREALRPGIGAVGAKLLDGEGRIQHAGIVLGTGGLVTHGHRHFPGDAPGYLAGLEATREVSAVTAACLVVEAGKFAAVGGFDEKTFAVDFNDVDLCLRLNAAGLRTLLVPSAVLHHREAASRRWTPEARARHEGEVAALKKRWGPLLAQDPHYHPGFDPDLGTYARLRRDWPEGIAAGPR